MQCKHKDLRGALQAAKEVLDWAKPEGDGTPSFWDSAPNKNDYGAY